jgi:hypothetical protein
MPNHVHLACAGGRGWVAGDLCRGAPALYRGDQHRFRWTGHLFQGRFGAVVMDKPHLLAAASRSIRWSPGEPFLAGHGRALGRSSRARMTS